MSAEREPVEIHLRIPTGTIVKVLLTCLLAWAVMRLWPEFVFLLISLLLAVAIHPVLVRLQGEKHPWEGPSGTVAAVWKPSTPEPPGK